MAHFVSHNPAYRDEAGRYDCGVYLHYWRKANPDKVLAQRLRAAERLLTRNGYTITPPTVSEEGGEEE